MHRDFDDLHQRSHEAEWRALAAARARSGTAVLLGELAAMGFATQGIWPARHPASGRNSRCVRTARDGGPPQALRRDPRELAQVGNEYVGKVDSGGHFLEVIDTCVAAPPRVAALRRNRWPKSPESAAGQHVTIPVAQVPVSTRLAGWRRRPRRVRRTGACCLK